MINSSDISITIKDTVSYFMIYLIKFFTDFISSSVFFSLSFYSLFLHHDWKFLFPFLKQEKEIFYDLTEVIWRALASLHGPKGESWWLALAKCLIFWTANVRWDEPHSQWWKTGYKMQLGTESQAYASLTVFFLFIFSFCLSFYLNWSLTLNSKNHRGTEDFLLLLLLLL